MKSEIVEISAVMVHETEKAVLIDHGGKEKCWLPKSAIEFEKSTDGKTITISLKQSLAEEKGII